MGLATVLACMIFGGMTGSGLAENNKSNGRTRMVGHSSLLQRVGRIQIFARR